MFVEELFFPFFLFAPERRHVLTMGDQHTVPLGLKKEKKGVTCMLQTFRPSGANKEDIIMRTLRNITLVCLCIVLWGNVGFAEEMQDIVRAKIGIQLRSGDEKRLATPFERVKTGDLYRIYVIPEPDPGYIYVVYMDEEIVGQLNTAEQTEIHKDALLTLPSPEEWYQFDASSKKVWITIICSANTLPGLETLLGVQNVSREDWKTFEKQIIEKSRIIPSDVPDKPWPLTGVLRDVEALKISSGKTVVVRKYEFTVKQ